METPMPLPTPQARIVLTTADNPREATRLARSLVEERPAACITRIPASQHLLRGSAENIAPLMHHGQ